MNRNTVAVILVFGTYNCTSSHTTLESDEFYVLTPYDLRRCDLVHMTPIQSSVRMIFFILSVSHLFSAHPNKPGLIDEEEYIVSEVLQHRGNLNCLKTVEVLVGWLGHES